MVYNNITRNIILFSNSYLFFRKYNINEGRNSINIVGVLIMNSYLMDTNVVIYLWKHCPNVINELIKDTKVKILEEISQELALKEIQEYNGQHVLSERFCNLLPLIIKVDKKDIKEFYVSLNIKHSKKGNAYYNDTEKLSENDLILLYTCCIYDDLILVTEDKYLFNTAIHVLGEGRVINLSILMKKYNFNLDLNK